MSERIPVAVSRVTTEQDRVDAVAVLRETYQREKHWVEDGEALLQPEELADSQISWFLARAEAPAGVLRVVYDPPILEYAKKYESQLSHPGLDLARFVRENRIAEVGRFAIRQTYRRQLPVVLALMRCAAEETVRRQYTHYITDVFEGEANSPLNFHTRVLGFQAVMTHDTGDLNCSRRRITLVLNLKAAYARLRDRRQRLYHCFTDAWEPTLHGELGT